MKKVETMYEQFYDVKLSKTEIKLLLQMMYDKVQSTKTLTQWAKNVGGLPAHLLEVYNKKG